MMGADASRAPNIRERYFDSQSYLPQNPCDAPISGNYHPYPPGYEIDAGPPDYGSNRFGQATYHHNVYTPVASTLNEGWSSGGGGWVSGGSGWPSGGSGWPSGGHKSKGSALSMSALTLLAFLFFINMLQTCLKEQMTSLNPTVMVMTAGTSRFRKTGTAGTAIDTHKELIQSDQAGVISTSVSDNIDMITNDQGDVFFGPAPKIAFQLDDTPQVRNSESSWQEIKT